MMKMNMPQMLFPHSSGLKPIISFKAKLLIGLLVGVISIQLLVLGGMSGLATVNDWFDSHTLQFNKVIEIKVQKPITVLARNMPILAPTMTYNQRLDIKPLTVAEKQEIINKSRFGYIVDKIWSMETTKGKKSNDPTALHEYCNSIGKTNEFGYDAPHKYCFDNFQDSVNKVNDWIEDQLMSKTLTQVLCFYNQGIASNSCNYSLAYASLR